MKPEDQRKVILLSFFSIAVMVAFITVVSIFTTQSVAGHHTAEGGHGEAAHEAAPAAHGEAAKPAEHAAPAAHGEAAKPAEHGADAKPAEHGDAAKPAEHGDAAKPAEHGDAAKPAEHAAAKPASGNAEAGAKVFLAKTCATCHAVSKLPEAKGAIGPKLDGLGKTAAERKPGTSAEAYIKESIENPTAFVAPGFQPAMPPLRASMNDTEFNDLVAFLASL